MTDYEPKPIDVSNVELPAELLKLLEPIAENIHEIWAEGRMSEGWVWGEERDDGKKTHPGLIPYKALTETEKGYDRATAAGALKTAIAMGFDIRKE